MTAAPASIRILGRDVRLELIVRATSANAAPSADDVLHSICHWIADVPSGLDPTDPPACRIGTGLARVLRDNPQLTRWLAESFTPQPQTGDSNGKETAPAA